jgi:tetratricopeptide (TPR) repeat protein
MRINCSCVIFGVLLIPLFLLIEANGQTNIEKVKLLYMDARFDDAIAELNSELDADPGIAEAYLYRGNAYYSKADFKSAIRDYSKAIEIEPDYALAYYNRAVANYSSQNFSMAWEDLIRARNLGYEPHLDFIEQLKEDTGRRD